MYLITLHYWRTVINIVVNITLKNSCMHQTEICYNNNIL